MPLEHWIFDELMKQTDSAVSGQATANLMEIFRPGHLWFGISGKLS